MKYCANRVNQSLKSKCSKLVFTVEAGMTQKKKQRFSSEAEKLTIRVCWSEAIKIKDIFC